MRGTWFSHVTARRTFVTPNVRSVRVIEKPMLDMKKHLFGCLCTILGCASSDPGPGVPTASVSASIAAQECATPKADCDHNTNNGCEVDLSTSSASCGACGVTCGPGQSCADGVCRQNRLLHNGRETCAIRDGRVYCWGYDGEFESPSEVTRVARILRNVDDAFSIHYSHTMSTAHCVLRKTGQVTCGDATPEPFGRLTHAVDIAVYRNVCAVMDTGAVVCGADNSGKLERLPDISDATAIAASDDNFYILRKSGHILNLDFQNQLYEMQGMTDAVQMEAQYHSLCVIRRDGSVACTGSDAAPDPPRARRFTSIEGVTDAVSIDVGCAVSNNGSAFQWVTTKATPIKGVSDAAQIACRGPNGCALKHSGALVCWGSRWSGAVGDGAVVSKEAPNPVQGVTNAKTVVAGQGTCVLAHDGTVWCWGLTGDTAGRRGMPAEQVSGLTGVKSLTSNFSRACAADGQGTVHCFETGLPNEPRTTFDLGGPVAKVIANRWDGYALLESGKVVAFDARAIEGVVKPERFAVNGVSDAIDIAVGDYHSCALTRPGKVYCWGLVSVEAFATRPANVAHEVEGLKDAVQMAVSGPESCVVRKNGETFCWSPPPNNAEAQPKPIKLPATRTLFRGLKDVEKIAIGVGGQVYCAVTRGGQLFCHGPFGHLRGISPRPENYGDWVPATGLTDVVDVVIETSHVCAVRKTGEVACWGSNQRDELGTAESPFALDPVRVELPKGDEPNR